MEKMIQTHVANVKSNSLNARRASKSNVKSKQIDRILKGVVAIVNAHFNNWDLGPCITAELERLGAKVEDGYTEKVTHLVFLNGARSEYIAAQKLNIHIVLPLWIEDSRAKLCRQDESKYIPDIPSEIPFFKKRRYRPMVKEIVAGTYVPYDLRKGATENPLLVGKSVKPRRHTELLNAVKEGKKEKVLDYEPAPENEDPISAKIRELFNNLEEVTPESMAKLFQSCMEAMKSRQQDVDNSDLASRATKLEDFVPLMNRCKARLEVKGIHVEFLEFPSPTFESKVETCSGLVGNENRVGRVKKSKDLDSLIDECKARLEAKGIHVEYLKYRPSPTVESKVKMCSGVVGNRKRKGVSLERASKKLKV